MSDPAAARPHRIRPEDPSRIGAFRAVLDGLRSDEVHAPASLSTLFFTVDALAEAEVAYYHRRRGTRAWISGVARALAWTCGSIGLLLPLLAATGAARFASWGPYGYAFLAAAACALAANTLFGGTDGHVRFVSTQLELERLITRHRIEWCRYLATAESRALGLDEGFALILAYADGLHATTIAETGRWGDGLLTELARYRSTVERQPGD